MTADRREILRHAYAEAAIGNGRPFVDMLADNVRYVVMGQTPWSGVYEGKEAMMNRCIRPVHARFQEPGGTFADRIMVDGDLAAIEGHGIHATKDGHAYNNRYCWVFRFEGEKVVEMVEYMDTALTAAALGRPGEGEGPDRAAA